MSVESATTATATASSPGILQPAETSATRTNTGSVQQEGPIFRGHQYTVQPVNYDQGGLPSYDEATKSSERYDPPSYLALTSSAEAPPVLANQPTELTENTPLLNTTNVEPRQTLTTNNDKKYIVNNPLCISFTLAFLLTMTVIGISIWQGTDAIVNPMFAKQIQTKHDCEAKSKMMIASLLTLPGAALLTVCFCCLLYIYDVCNRRR